MSVDRQERTLPYVTVWRWHSDAVIRQIAHFRKCTKSMDNKFDVILHVLQKRNIWMKNKKKPFCEHAQRTDAYVTGEQKGFDAVIRQIAHF